MKIIDNPQDVNSQIIDNKDLLELLETHLRYVTSLRITNCIFLSAEQTAFLEAKISRLTDKILYLHNKIDKNNNPD